MRERKSRQRKIELPEISAFKVSGGYLVRLPETGASEREVIRQCWASLGLVILRRFEEAREGKSRAAALLGRGKEFERGTQTTLSGLSWKEGEWRSSEAAESGVEVMKDRKGEGLRKVWWNEMESTCCRGQCEGTYLFDTLYTHIMSHHILFSILYIFYMETQKTFI